MAVRDGFSLIEVMVALGILAFAVLGATSGQIMAMKLSTTSRHAALAMELAEQQMETLQAMPAADVKTLGSATDLDNPLDPDPNDGIPMTFNRSWTITPDGLTAGVITMQVDVSWTNALGQTITTSLQNLKADL